MIPKIIHYCWFGHNPKSQNVLKYIDTWKNISPIMKSKNGMKIILTLIN